MGTCESDCGGHNGPGLAAMRLGLCFGHFNASASLVCHLLSKMRGLCKLSLPAWPFLQASPSTHFRNLQDVCLCNPGKVSISVEGISYPHFGEDSFQVVGSRNGKFRDEHLDPPMENRMEIEGAMMSPSIHLPAASPGRAQQDFLRPASPANLSK